MSLSLSRRDDGGMLVISAAGDLDLAAAETFEREIAAVMTTGVSGVVVDLSGVAFVDSAGINALLKGRRMADEHGRSFRVEGAGRFVHEVLVMTGVWSHLSGTP